MSFDPHHAHGSLRSAIAYCERLVAGGGDETMFLINTGTVAQGAALEMVRNLGRRELLHSRGRS